MNDSTRPPASRAEACALNLAGAQAAIAPLEAISIATAARERAEYSAAFAREMRGSLAKRKSPPIVANRGPSRAA
jgi:hypothetical protein